jgi:hypothetical protein
VQDSKYGGKICTGVFMVGIIGASENYVVFKAQHMLYVIRYNTCIYQQSTD